MTIPLGETEIVTEGPPLAIEPDQQIIRGRSIGQIAWRRLRHDKVAMTGGIVAILVVLVAILAGPLTKWYGQSPTAQHQNLLDPATTMPVGHFSGASSTHWLGITPVLGQDILAQLIYGARTSLIVAVGAMVLALLFGVTLGIAAGFFGGFIDSITSRTMDMLLAFPVLLFSIALITVFSLVNSFLGLHGQVLRFAVLIFVIGFFAFPYIGRIMRGQVLSIREKEFVDASRSIGSSSYRIMTREILPNLVGPILVYATLYIPAFVLAEAGLSYLGVGVLPPTVSWGSMLSDAGQYLQIDPWFLFCPGMAIFITTLSFNLFGDGLRDAFDPKSRR